MSDNQEKDYGTTGPSPEQEETAHGAGEEVAEEQAGESEPVGDVYSLVRWFILVLSESAWQWMGLQMNPATKKVEKDLAQARIAVDSIVFLTDQIAPHISEDERKAYRTLVNDLRVNFVQQSQS